MTRPGAPFACATLRRDGFVSLDANETPGVLTTKTLPARGFAVIRQYGCRGGTLLVEILDQSGNPIADSESHDWETHREPRQWIWKKGSLEALKGQPIRLRFTLRNASLYSFWFTD